MKVGTGVNGCKRCASCSFGSWDCQQQLWQTS